MLLTRIQIATGLCIAASGGLAVAQRSSQPVATISTGVIAGAVVDAVTNRPLASATVTLVPSNRSVRTDDQGLFAFSGLRAGEFRLMSSLGGYATSWFGARAPLAGEQPFDLVDGEKVSGLVIRMWENATVTGTVTDAAQAPVVGASLIAARVEIIGGRITFDDLGHSATTDEHGVYRLASLPPGDFTIVLRSPADVTPNAAGNSAAGYPTVFYPDAISTLGASIVTLSGGETRSDIDFHLARGPSFVIRGHVTGATGPHELLLLPTDPGRIPNMIDVRRTLADAQGRFAFRGVLAGQYSINVMEVPKEPVPEGTSRISSAQHGNAISTVNSGPSTTLPLAPTPSAPTLWASVPVAVLDQNIDDVEVPLTAAACISGTVVFDGTAPKPDAVALASTPVMVLATDGRELGMLPGSGIDATGHFQTVGVPPGPYQVWIVPRLFQGWSLASVMVGGWEMIGVPVDVGTADVHAMFTFTDRPGRLSGLVRDADGKAAADATIYVFSTDRRQWANGAPIIGTTRALRPARNGRYQATLAPGEYYVAAVEATARENWQGTDVLDALAQAANIVRIGVGNTVTLDLRVRRGQ
jgi:hypothetical protein